MSRREPTAEEIALFEATLKDAVQFRKKIAHVTVRPGAAKAKLKSEGAVAVLPRHGADLPGLDGRTIGRLARGGLEPEARLDLHGMTEAIAHRALITFVYSAVAHGHRLVLVVTGKGLPDDPYAPFDLELAVRRRGVLRTLTPRWLAEPGLARFIADVRTAHRRHGGEGALYIYLRKSR